MTIAVIFEVEPAAGRHDAYLRMAGELKPLLAQIDGFRSVERFASLTTPGKLLSLSIWRDEEAVKNWRNVAEHRQAQRAGRGGIFADYRLRIAHVVREYGMKDREQAPEDSRAAHEERSGERKVRAEESEMPPPEPSPAARERGPECSSTSDPLSRGAGEG